MKKLRLGIFGMGERGWSLVNNFLLLGCDLVAVCDDRKEMIERAERDFGKGFVCYDNFDEFIEHGLDVVILTNFFNEHAPYAIKCFEKNIHVFSECISNGTMAEGVELVRAFEKSKSIYMLAENYPQMKFNREIKRVCDTGTLGKIMYAEGEYNHPGDPKDSKFAKNYRYKPSHWRNYLPSTYYVTHSLGPIMWATGATPKRITAFPIFAPVDEKYPTGRMNGDRTAVMMTHNDDGSVFKFTGCAAFGGHGNSYRVSGTQGTIENLRGMGDKVMLRYNSWEKPEGVEEINFYEPDWNDKDEEFIKKSGHGGGDYLTCRMFVESIRNGVQPPHPFDIYSATAMSSVAILGHRSVLENGMPYDIPDFRKEEDRVKYENDRLTPFIGKNGEEPTIPCCSVPSYAPTKEQVDAYKELIDYKD